MGIIIAILLAVLGLFAQTAGTALPCKRRDCEEPRRGSQFCVGHECPVQGCNAAPKRGEVLCGPHLDQAQRVWAEGGDYTVSQPQDPELDPEPEPTPDPEPTPEPPTGKWAGLFVTGGTGSRSLRTANIAAQRAVWAWLLTELTALKAVHGDGLRVISGMAEGFDEALAKAALQLEIPFIAMLPNKTYGSYYWGQKSLTGRDRLEEFNELLSQAHQTVYTDRLFKIQGKGLYYDPKTLQASKRSGPGLIHSNLVRNQGIVNWSDQLLAYNVRSVGTSDCISRAKKAGVPWKEYSA